MNFTLSVTRQCFFYKRAHILYRIYRKFDSKQTKGNFSLLEEERSMLSMALLAKGFSANSTKTDEINQAVEHIHHAKKDPHFIGFDPSEISKDKVLAKIDWAAIVFNGEAMDAINEDTTLQYAIPKEGSFMWVTSSSRKTASLTQPRKKSTVWYSCATWATPPSSSMQLGQPSRRTK